MTLQEIFKSSFLENIGGVSLLDMALALYQDGTTFERTGIEAYTPQGG